jgi:uncharacterized membrane protein (UPF0136 family)
VVELILYIDHNHQ